LKYIKILEKDIVIYVGHIKIIGQTLLVKNVIKMFVKIIANNELNAVEDEDLSS